MTHHREPEPGGSFEAHRVTVRLWSERFGVEVWLVPEPTGKDRIEITAAAAREFVLVTEILGGEVLELTVPGGRTLRPVPGWEERVGRRKLLDRQVQYDLHLDRERKLRGRLDDRSAGSAERDRVRKEWEREVAELNQLIAEIGELGHEMTGVEIREGFEGSLRRSLAGEVAPVAPSPTPAEERLSLTGGALTVESARDILRRERLLGAIGGP